MNTTVEKVALQNVIIVQNEVTDPDSRCYNRASSFLSDNGVNVFRLGVDRRDRPVILDTKLNPDMVIVLGGDGTFLRTAQCFAKSQVPMVGINTGNLGFLTRIEADRMEAYLSRLIEGAYMIEHRMMLAVGAQEELALNDVVFKNANPSQMATLTFYVNDDLVAVYDADGIIISTPTGSTAYSMAAGGPIMSPEIEAVSITPICPHSMSAKPIVIPADKTMRIESARGNHSDVVVAVDGLESLQLPPGESMCVYKASLALPIVNFGQDVDDFYLLLKKKLQWASNPRRGRTKA